jgi:hypothetical protein
MMIIWMKEVAVYFNVKIPDEKGETENNHEKPQKHGKQARDLHRVPPDQYP